MRRAGQRALLGPDMRFLHDTILFCTTNVDFVGVATPFPRYPAMYFSDFRILWWSNLMGFLAKLYAYTPSTHWNRLKSGTPISRRNIYNHWCNNYQHSGIQTIAHSNEWKRFSVYYVLKYLLNHIFFSANFSVVKKQEMIWSVRQEILLNELVSQTTNTISTLLGQLPRALETPIKTIHNIHERKGRQPSWTNR